MLSSQDLSQKKYEGCHVLISGGRRKARTASLHPACILRMMIRCCCSRLVLVDLERKIRCLQKKRDMRRTPCQTVECKADPRSERRRMLPFFVSTGGVATPHRVAGRATLHAVAAARTVAARGRCLFISRPPGNKRMAKRLCVMRDREMRVMRAREIVL